MVSLLRLTWAISVPPGYELLLTSCSVVIFSMHVVEKAARQVNFSIDLILKRTIVPDAENK